MKEDEIERLLTEFYEGNTTEYQEELLKDYFKTTDVSVHLLKDKRLFEALYVEVSEDDMPVSTTLQKRLESLIDKNQKEEPHFCCPNRMKRSWRWTVSVTASVLLFLGLGYHFITYYEETCPSTPKDTFTNPEAAYEVLQATLLEISINLNNGMNEIEETQQEITKINQEVRNELKQ